MSSTILTFNSLKVENNMIIFRLLTAFNSYIHLKHFILVREDIMRERGDESDYNS